MKKTFIIEKKPKDTFEKVEQRGDYVLALLKGKINNHEAFCAFVILREAEFIDVQNAIDAKKDINLEHYEIIFRKRGSVITESEHGNALAYFGKNISGVDLRMPLR